MTDGACTRTTLLYAFHRPVCHCQSRNVVAWNTAMEWSHRRRRLMLFLCHGKDASCVVHPFHHVRFHVVSSALQRHCCSETKHVGARARAQHPHVVLLVLRPRGNVA